MCPEVGAPGSKFKHTHLLVAPDASALDLKAAPSEAHLKTLNDGLLNTGLPEQGLETDTGELPPKTLEIQSAGIKLGGLSSRVSPPALLGLTGQGLHFSWCHLIAMMNAIVTNQGP